MKKALVLGAGGFIGSHLVKRLKKEGFWVRGVDIKYPEYAKTEADEFLLYDLRDQSVVKAVMRLESIEGNPINFSFLPTAFSYSEPFDEVYQLAADMGGAGYIFSGENDADVMSNSANINLNVALEANETKVKRLFFSSSACVYPKYNQLDPENPKCTEESAYPAAPDSEYGWEKLFSERVYLSYNRNYNLDVRIARFHNIYGPEGTYTGGKEKAPAALCRKVSQAIEGDEIEVWGDGLQTRSFLYIDECLNKMLLFMRQDNFVGPVNIGSEEMISINDLAKMTIKISGKNLTVKNIEGPTGVRGRNSDNNLYRAEMGDDVYYPLELGITKTYRWIDGLKGI